MSWLLIGRLSGTPRKSTVASLSMYSYHTYESNNNNRNNNVLPWNIIAFEGWQLISDLGAGSRGGAINGVNTGATGLLP